MNKRKVWNIVPKGKIPQEREPIGCKWVLKIKRDRRYRARLVCLRYTQVPGIDFQDNFAPVVNDMTFRTILTLTAMYNWKMTILDVETAFLYGDLKEDIYMKIPAGFFSLEENITNTKKLLNREFDMRQVNKKVCLKLNHALYGLVQAARSWWLEFLLLVRT